jgi:hypothetical protein
MMTSETLSDADTVLPFCLRLTLLTDRPCASVLQAWVESSPLPVVFISMGTIATLNKRQVRPLCAPVCGWVKA